MKLRKLVRILSYTTAGLIGLVLVVLSVFKLTLDRAPAHQDEIKAWVHRQTGFYIRFAHVSPAVRWHGPELYFQELELRSKDDRRVLARAAGGRIGTDLWQLLRHGRLLAGRVELDQPDIVVARLGANAFALASEIGLPGQGSGTSLSLDDLPAGRLVIRGGRVTLQNWNAALPSLVLEGVDLNIRRNSDTVTLSFDSRLPPMLGGTLTVAGTASGLADAQSLAWSADARARDMSFAGWRLLWPEYLNNLSGGSGAFRLRASGRGAIPARMDLDFAAQAVVARWSDDAGVKFDQISGEVVLTHSGDRWALSGRRMRASRDGRNDPVSQFDVSWRAADSGLLELRAQANYLRAESLLPLTGLLPQQDLRERLREIAPTGEWLDAGLTLQRANAADPWAMQVHAKFRDAGFAPLGRAPGWRGLSGVISGNQSGGHIELDARSPTVIWPRQWMQPVELDALRGTLFWKRTTTDLLIATPDLQAKNRDATASAHASLLLPADGSPVLTAVGEMRDGNFGNTRAYLPRELIPPKALEWLDRAFVEGRLSRGDLILRGPVRQFPFRDGSGLFLARLDLNGVTLDYADGWPRLENAGGHVEFHNEGLSVRLLGATAGGLAIDRGDARFADFKTGELEVHLNGAADAAATLDFLRATPIDAMAGHVFSGVDAAGPLRGRIDLFLPFKDFQHRRILVHGDLDGVTLNRPGLPLTATELEGDVDFDGGQVAHADVRGRLLGGGFRMQAHSPKTLPLTRTQLDFHGILSGDAARSALGLPANAAIRGLSDWRAVLRLAPEPARERSLRISGSLAGLEFLLPEPLLKPAGRPLPSWVEIQWPAAAGPQVSVGLGSVLRGTFAFEPESDGMRIEHAAIGFGAAEPVFSDAQIVNVSGNIGRLDLGGWLKLRNPDKNAKPLAYYLRTAGLHFEEVDYLGLKFRAVALDAAAAGDRWRLAVSGANLAGVISLPMAAESADPWDLQFDTVNLDEDAAAAVPGIEPIPPGPQSVPSIIFHAKEFSWGERHLGVVQANLTKLNDGVSLDHLTVLGSGFGIDAKGEWRGKDAGLGRIEGALTSSDVGLTLKQLGYAEVISAKDGRLDFDLNWSGAPTIDALREAIGHVQVTLDKGQVSGIDPGAGRVLGLASVAALPRRLALDFTDLTEKGLAFDTIRGGFDIRGGNAFTDDVLLKGPAADIGMIGRVGLKNKDYDQTAVVTGNVGSSLPIAGALVGGPVIGAAVLLFTQVFKQPLRGLARGYYRITGPWDSPTVERIKSAGAAAAAEVAK